MRLFSQLSLFWKFTYLFWKNTHAQSLFYQPALVCLYTVLVLFLQCSYWVMSLSKLQFWPKYLGTIEQLHFLSQIITRITIPPLPHSMLKKLAGNTTGIFVNTHFNSEMAEWGELKSHVSIFLSKVYLSQHFWRRL